MILRRLRYWLLDRLVDWWMRWSMTEGLMDELRAELARADAALREINRVRDVLPRVVRETLDDYFAPSRTPNHD